MMEGIIFILLLCIVVVVITEKMTIRRLNVENGVVVSKGRCVLKPGYGPIQPPSSSSSSSSPITDDGTDVTDDYTNQSNLDTL